MKKKRNRIVVAHLKPLSRYEGAFKRLRIYADHRITNFGRSKMHSTKQRDKKTYISKHHISIIRSQENGVNKFQIKKLSDNPVYINGKIAQKDELKDLEDNDEVGIITNGTDEQSQDYPVYKFEIFKSPVKAFLTTPHSKLTTDVLFGNTQTFENSPQMNSSQDVNRQSPASSSSVDSLNLFDPKSTPTPLVSETPRLKKRKKRITDAKSPVIQPPKKRVKTGDHYSSSPTIPSLGFPKQVQPKQPVSVPVPVMNNDPIIEGLKDSATCKICQMLLQDAIQLSPCSHHFCGVCISEHHRLGKVDCPYCRKESKGVQINFSMRETCKLLRSGNHESEEDKEAQEEKKKSENYYTNDYFKDNNLQDIYPKKYGSNQVQVPPPPGILGRIPHYVNMFGNLFVVSSEEENDEEDEENSICEECVIEGPDGFKCSSNPSRKVHKKCANCSKLMPVRENLSPDDERQQKCRLCDKYFCNLYFEELSDCDGQNVLKKLSEHQFSEFASFTFNKFELEYFREWMNSKNKSVQDIWRETLEKLDIGEYTPTPEPSFFVTNPIFANLHDRICHKEGIIVTKEELENLTSDTVCCGNCAICIFRDSAHIYRKAIPKEELSNECVSRTDCWHGRECRTQWKENLRHCKLNHCCENTRKRKRRNNDNDKNEDEDKDDDED